MDLKVGDHIVFLLDREKITDEDLADTGDTELQRMAGEWQREHSARFFFTVGRKWQPVPDTEFNTFESHDDSVLFVDKTALLTAMPELVRRTAGAVWLILAAADVEAEIRKKVKNKPD